MKVEWTKEQKEDVVNNAADVCSNIDGLRQVMIISISTDGSLNLVERRRNDASLMETLGAYRIALKNVEAAIEKQWVDDDRPHLGGGSE